MKCYEFNLENILKITLSGRQLFTNSRSHITRVNPENIMYFQVAGSLHLENAGEELLLNPGDTYFFKKGDFQKPLSPSAGEFYFVHFTTDPVAEFEISEKEYRELVANKKSPFCVYLKQRNHIKSPRLLSQVIDILKGNKIWSKSGICDVLSCFSAFSSILFMLENIDCESSESNNDYFIVKRISDFIVSQYNENLDSSTLEEIFHINYDYANRLFKKIKGTSIMEYRNRMRIIAAKEKLAVSDASITQIASDVCFKDACYFSRYFKKSENISPQKFRERFNKNETL